MAKDVIRVAKNNGTVQPTAKRLAQRSKITACNAFAKAFAGTGFFSKTFPAFNYTGSGYNRAVSALMSLALVPSQDGVTITYPLVLISKGKLPPAPDAGLQQLMQAIYNSPGRTIPVPVLLKTRISCVGSLLSSTNALIFSIGAATREAGYAVLDTANRKGEVAETWMGFLSNDEADAAFSVYTGSVVL